MQSFSFQLWALAMKTTVVSHRELREREAFNKRYFSKLINLLMWLQIHNIRFHQVCCEHLQTNVQLVIFTRVLFGVGFFFSKIMPESWGYGLYTSKAYTQVLRVIGI